MSTRDLIIMRHAKSNWSGESTSDFDRPLNSRGLLDAPRIGKWMASQNLSPDILISSPALRAKQTTAAIIEHLEVPQLSTTYDQRMYLANIETLLAIIAEIDHKCQTAMLVGHNPGLENLALNLSSDKLPVNSDGSLMTTANIIQLRFNQTWNNINSEQGTLIRLMRPKELN